jgi:hypothetical protein
MRQRARLGLAYLSQSRDVRFRCLSTNPRSPSVVIKRVFKEAMAVFLNRVYRTGHPTPQSVVQRNYKFVFIANTRTDDNIFSVVCIATSSVSPGRCYLSCYRLFIIRVAQHQTFPSPLLDWSGSMAVDALAIVGLVLSIICLPPITMAWIWAQRRLFAYCQFSVSSGPVLI